MEIVIIGKLWPEPKSSAAGKRMMQLIQLLKLQGNVTFACPAHKTGYECELDVKTKVIGLNDDSFDDFIKEKAPTIVIFDRFMTEEQFGWRVIENCPRAIRILNTEDLHFLRKTRGEALKSAHSLTQLNFHNDHTMRELASIYRCDLTLLTSDFELQLLIDTFGIPAHLVYYLPIFSTGQQKDLVKFSDRKDLVFIGNFLHEPNLDALVYLKKDVWSKVRKKRSDINLHIYGAYANQQVLEFHNPKECFFVHGRADNAHEVIQKAKLLLAPLRFGAGIKGKFIDAMEVGTPSVTSTIGIEGISESEQWPGLVANTPNEIIDAINKLYDDENSWVNKQQKGAELLENKFHSNLYSSNFVNKLNELIVNFQIHRNKSFTSQIIQHQSLMATKYLSKWIMEKQHSK